jgi:pyruvate formate lyase activating enzyme
MSGWIRKNLGPDTPLHFSAFFPQHKLTGASPTTLKMLENCRDIAAKEGLRWVYVGNVTSSKYENTICPECGGMLIGRDGYRVLSMREKCENCGIKVPLAGKKWMKA